MGTEIKSPALLSAAENIVAKNKAWGLAKEDKEVKDVLERMKLTMQIDWAPEALTLRRTCMALICLLVEELGDCSDRNRQNSLCNCINLAIDILESAS